MTSTLYAPEPAIEAMKRHEAAWSLALAMANG